MENDVTASEEQMQGVTQLVDWFEEAEQASETARRLSERDRDYVDGKQLTADQKRVLKKRGQPPIVFNVVKDKVGFLMGVEKQTRTDPKAYPRTPKHEEDAEAATEALRFVAEDQDFHSHRSRVARNLFVEGTGGLEVGVKQTARGIEVSLRRVPWDRFFADPHSSERDFSDARYLGQVLWMDIEEAKGRYPEAQGALLTTYNNSTYGDTYDDKPKWKLWADRGRRRVRVVQMYFQRDGIWYYAEFTKSGMLKGGESPYLDEDQKPCCPLIMESAYVDRENNRYGEVRQFIDPQDEINKRRSKALHILNTRQIIYEKGAGVDSRAVREELAKPDGAVELPPGVMSSGGFQIERNTDMSAGQAALLQDAMAYLDKSGPNAAMMGDAEGQSGRAIQAQQQGGMMEMGDLLDTLRRFDTRVYRAVWNRIRQFWTEERWVRVTDDEKNVKFVGFNQPVTLADSLQEMETDQERAAVMQQMNLYPNDPRLNMPVQMRNDVSQMGVDIIIEDAPDTITLQQEQFDALVKVLPVLVNAPPQFTTLIIQASQLRNKAELLKSLEGGEDPQQAALAQMRQQLEELQAKLGIQKAEADVDKTRTEARLNEARAINEIQNAQLPPTMATMGQ